MIRGVRAVAGYAARAVPWTCAGVGLLFVVVAMALVAGWPGVMWPLQGTAVGVLAGVAAWSQDEPSAALVDTLPRSMRWRILGRAAAAAAAIAVWLACLAATHDRLPPNLALLVLEGVTAVVAALALAARRRRLGIAEPGRHIADVAVPTMTALALIRPYERWLPVFPIQTGDDRSLLIWLVIGAGSLVVLAGALRDAPPQPR